MGRTAHPRQIGRRGKAKRDKNRCSELREAIQGVGIKSMAWNENLTGVGLGISVQGNATFADLVLFVES